MLLSDLEKSLKKIYETTPNLRRDDFKTYLKAAMFDDGATKDALALYDEHVKTGLVKPDVQNKEIEVDNIYEKVVGEVNRLVSNSTNVAAKVLDGKNITSKVTENCDQEFICTNCDLDCLHKEGETCGSDKCCNKYSSSDSKTGCYDKNCRDCCNSEKDSHQCATDVEVVHLKGEENILKDNMNKENELNSKIASSDNSSTLKNIPGPSSISDQGSSTPVWCEEIIKTENGDKKVTYLATLKNGKLVPVENKEELEYLVTGEDKHTSFVLNGVIAAMLVSVCYIVYEMVSSGRF